MIKKERLEELIEQGATIYGVDYGRVLMADIVKIKTNDIYYCSSNDNFQYVYKEDGDCYLYEFYDEHLFETKEDAEEYAEFGNITRTERLDLPSWEEFNKVSTFTFKRKDGTDMEIAIWHNCPDDDCKTIKITRSYDWSACCFEKPLTRKNYDDARRICVKLFKGKNIDG